MEHLLDHVTPYLKMSLEERITFIRSPRWIGYSAALQAHRRLGDLLSRPAAMRTNGLMLIGPYANGKTMIAERFAIQHLRTAPAQKVWVIQTHEGSGLSHFYSSILTAFKAPMARAHGVAGKADQIDQLFNRLSPQMLIFDEFHNALRGRAQDTEAIFGFLRRLGRVYDISPVLLGEVAIYDHVNATDEMASRFELCSVPRWQYGEEYLTLLDSLEAALPLARDFGLSAEPMARKIHALSEGLIGENVAIVSRIAVHAITSGIERVTLAAIEMLPYVPLSARRQSPQRNKLL